MRITSPRLRRLDNALADLAYDSDAMMLSELDGYIAGVILCPEDIPAAEWLPPIWAAAGEPPPFADEREAHWFNQLALEHRDAVVRTLQKGHGRYTPFLEVDLRHDETMWEPWIEGFDAATALRPESWSRLVASAGGEVAEAVAGLATLSEIARDESSLEREEIDALTEEAPDLIPGWIELLHGWRVAQPRSAAAAPIAPPPAKIGRNDPCPCGSGRKYKKCCGLA